METLQYLTTTEGRFITEWVRKICFKIIFLQLQCFMCSLIGVIILNAPINVKPEGGGEGVSGGRATHGNLIVAYIPRVRILIGHHAFDLSILYSRREVNHLFLLILVCPGVGILITFCRRCHNPHPMPYPPPLPLGLTLIGA